MSKEIIIMVGALLSFVGLIGIMSIGFISLKIKKEAAERGLDINKKKTVFETLITVNYASLLLSFVGLILIVISSIAG